MKRFLSITVIALTLLAFTACGGSKKNKDNTDTGDTDTDVVDTDSTDTSDTTPEGDNNSESDTETPSSGCTGISVDWENLTYYYGAYFATTEVGDKDLEDSFIMEIIQENADGSDIAIGEYDLGKGANTNYKTCTECVRVSQDYVEAASEDESGSYTKLYFQKSGTLKIEGFDNDGNIKGTLAAKLIEVTIDFENRTYESTPVEGGECLEIESATFDSGVCVPHCEEGWECGNDGCGGSCGICEGKACSADFQCVPFNCDKLGEVSEFELVAEDSWFGTNYYYDAYTTGNGIGSASVPDLLEIGLIAEELKEGKVTLTSDIDNITDAYVLLYEDYDLENQSIGKYYFQESGTLEFTEVKEGTLESKGKGSFRLVEIDTDYIPVAGGKCFEVENIIWDTICVPQCDGKVCGDDGCGGTCGDGCGEDTTCNAAQTECVPYECETIALSNDDADKTFDSTYKSYRTTYTPNTGDAALDDLFSMQLFYVDPVLGEHDLAGTNYMDDAGIFIFVWEDEQAKSYFQQKGTVNVTAYDETTGAITVSFKDLRVEEVSINSSTYETIPVAGGKCYEITDTTFTYAGE